MELRHHPHRHFMGKYERFEPLIPDSSAMTTAKECLRKYFFEYVIAKKPKEEPIYFAFGGAYHKFREVLEQNYSKGDKEGDFKTALIAALEYWHKKQKGDPPVGHKFDFMTELRLQQSCLVAYNHWKTEKAQNKIIVISIEQPFNVAIDVNGDERTSGRFDQIIRWNGKVYGRDFKTTSKEGVFYTRGHAPNDQFTRYTFAESLLCGERVHGQFVEAMYNSKKSGPQITNYLTTRTDWEIEDWRQDELFWRQILETARNQDRWPKNERACSFCTFHSVCKMGSEGAQMAKLDSEFVTRIWDNANPDGE